LRKAPALSERLVGRIGLQRMWRWLRACVVVGGLIEKSANYQKQNHADDQWKKRFHLSGARCM